MPCGPCAQIQERCARGRWLQTGAAFSSPMRCAALRNTKQQQPELFVMMMMMMISEKMRSAMERGYRPAGWLIRHRFLQKHHHVFPFPRKDGPSTEVSSPPRRDRAAPAGLHGSRPCGCCQLLSRQCRSCVAISSYIWLLGLRRLGLLPGRACPSCSPHWLVAHSNPPIGCDVKGRGGSLHPVTPQTGCSLCHNSTRGPCQGFLCWFFFTPSSSAILLILPVSASLSLLMLSELLFVRNVLGESYQS
ncbi:uncharacterized protein LOC119500315 [Sebastes umbrosus]|uniref:uncharacterized protein LOC119500315 n=1 Tax=Sebastes umbrosus TaxID=72105 RepID=UPI0018A0CD1C|nr:uncharacterized protein LOC119500315 [Sebastes umbrosus]